MSGAKIFGLPPDQGVEFVVRAETCFGVFVEVAVIGDTVIEHEMVDIVDEVVLFTEVDGVGLFKSHSLELVFDLFCHVV